MTRSLPTDSLIKTEGAYLVGGSVRDLICGRPPADYDIAVVKDPEGYAQQLATKLNGRVVNIGKRGFPLYRIVKAALMVDVTPIKGNQIATDLMDRDFTINALAYELASDTMIDPTGGVADIEQGVVRMVSAHAFRNDPVRLLRAYRMAAYLDFDMDPDTSRAIQTAAGTIQTAAGERVWTELSLILACPESFDQLRQMAQSGLLTAIFPEMVPLKRCRQSPPHHYDVFDHTLQAFQALEAVLAHPAQHLSKQAVAFFQTLSETDLVLLKLAVLLHDIGKPGQRTSEASGKVHFYGHAAHSAKLAGDIFQRLRMSRQHAHWVEFIIGNHSRPLELFLLEHNNNLSPKALGKFLRACADATPHIIAHAIADHMGKFPSNQHPMPERLVFFNQLFNAYFDTAAPAGTAPLINGDDLMAVFNLPPSPLLGAVLEGIEEARLSGTIHHRQQALNWANNYLKEMGAIKKTP